MPDDVSKKSLKVLDKKLQNAGRARRVSRQHQLGGGRRDSRSGRCPGGGKARRWSWDSRRRSASFTMATASCVRWASSERAVYHEMKAMENRHFARFNFFQDAIAQGKPNDWRCRAGARYMYICEDGLVHYCSQQRGYPAKPLEKYTVGGHPPRVSHRKILRAVLHRQLRALRLVLRFLARQADHPPGSAGTASREAGKDSVGEVGANTLHYCRGSIADVLWRGC